MKIGELFIALGFKVEGQDKLADTERSVGKTALQAGKLTLAINAVNAALLVMMTTAGRAGQVLKTYVKETGLDPVTLQQWQHLGVVAGSTADHVKNAFETLQKTRAEFALGEPSNVGVWQLLGVSPNQEPEKVLAQLRQSVRNMDPAIATELLSRLGLTGIIPVLRATDAEFSKWSKSFLISRDQIDRLAKFNSAWESLKMSAEQTKNLFAAALAPALTKLAKGLEWATSILATFFDWLNKGGAVATVLRYALIGLVLVLFTLGAGLALVTGALTALTLAMIALDVALWAGGIAPLLLTIFGLLALITGIVAGLLILIDDIITSLRGGKAFTRELGEWLAGFKAVRAVILSVMWVWDRMMAVVRYGFAQLRNSFTGTIFRLGILILLDQVHAALNMVRNAWRLLVLTVSSEAEAILRPFRDLLNIWDQIADKAKFLSALGSLWPALLPRSLMSADRVADHATEPARKAASTTNMNQENHLHVAIDGSRNPEATGKAVSKSFRDEIASAAYQMPVPNY